MTKREQNAALAALAQLNRDLDFMQTPERWPRYPRLPLKRRDGVDIFGDPHALALLIADGNPIVYFGNLHSARATADMERKIYPSFHALAIDYTVD